MRRKLDDGIPARHLTLAQKKGEVRRVRTLQTMSTKFLWTFAAETPLAIERLPTRILWQYINMVLTATHQELKHILNISCDCPDHTKKKKKGFPYTCFVEEITD